MPDSVTDNLNKLIIIIKIVHHLIFFWSEQKSFCD